MSYIVPSWVKNLDFRLIESSAYEFNECPFLLAAIVQTESAGNTFVIRYEPKYKYTFKIDELSKIARCTYDTMIFMQKTSFGLCQIMGGVYYGLTPIKEMENFREATWATILLDPEINLEYCCKVIAKIRTRYNLGVSLESDVSQIYAAYNAGSVRYNSEGKFVNHKNVDRFLRLWREVSKWTEREIKK